MGDRVIMHVDMNAFYASVAQHLDPGLRGKAVAVAGDPERRNGIILAKSREAKACGVKTAEAIWQAKQKCPDLVVVPPDYAAYKRYSRLARMIYYGYTDLVEPFGLDRLDVDRHHGVGQVVMDAAGEERRKAQCAEKDESFHGYSFFLFHK